MIKTLIRTLSLIAAFFVLSAMAQDRIVQQDYPLGGGDDLRVLVFQNPELTTEARVSGNGTITFPLIGEVQVGGLSIAAAEKKIATAL